MTTSPLNPTPTPTITTAIVPSNLLPQLTENTATACTSDRLQIQTTTTTTITTPSQLPTQQALPLPPRSFNLKEQPQQEPITKTLHLNSDNPRLLTSIKVGLRLYASAPSLFAEVLAPQQHRCGRPNQHPYRAPQSLAAPLSPKMHRQNNNQHECPSI